MLAAVQPQYDAALIAKYGGEGPRYTSYPTAVQFSQDFDERRWRQALKKSNQLPIPADLSLYVHVPFCASPCFYCGCNRVITRSPVAGAEFLEDFERELGLVAPLLDADRRVRQVHLGGGTPTFLSIAQIDRLMRSMREKFSFDEDGEFGLEIDPRTVEPGDLQRLRALGFNRLSVGIQDLDPQVQQAINRIHDTGRVSGILGAAHAVGFESISVDLIYGLPLQTEQAFERTVAMVIDMKPHRLSLFNYAHLPHLFKAQTQIDEDQLPSPETKLALFRNALAQLIAAGYEFIGMDHFALPEDPLARARADGTMVRNFQGYSTHGELDLIGFGPSAISQAGDHFAQNERSLGVWQQRVRDGHLAVVRGLTRTTDDRLRADVIAAIMCRGEVQYRHFEQDYELSFRSYFAAELARIEALANDGLVEMNAAGFRVRRRGMLFLRAIAMCFDAHLPRGPGDAPRFSRVV